MAPTLVYYLASGLSLAAPLSDIIGGWNVPHIAGFHRTEAYSFLSFSFTLGFLMA